jgi:hypothetical protein
VNWVDGFEPMRKLSKNFIDSLKTGFLSGITSVVISDKDLDFQIRNNYINIYFKGNSLLKLIEINKQIYKVDINHKFIGSVSIPDLVDEKTTETFIKRIPELKDNIIRYGVMSLEVEYEQLIIRANNNEPRNNSEYFVIDRQYATPVGRFDLTGIFWNRNKRRKKQEVPLCFMEIKFALNQDIKEVHDQIAHYYNEIKGNTKFIAEEAENILRQKIDLGLFDQAENRLEAMKTLNVSKNIDEYQFILVLVDYNPFSKSLDLEKLKALPFAKQVKLFYGGFAMWERNLSSYPDLSFGG